jgi:hypothetical protein
METLTYRLDRFELAGKHAINIAINLLEETSAPLNNLCHTGKIALSLRLYE